jgi:threonine dehydratase
MPPTPQYCWPSLEQRAGREIWVKHENHTPVGAFKVRGGLGSGLSGLLAAKHALGIATDIIMAVAENAPSYALSLANRTIVPAPARTMADGMSCRIPNADALNVFLREQPRVVMVSEEQIMDAMRAYFTDTHNAAEGAGAAPLAAALSDPERERYKRIGVVLTGGNVDSDIFRSVL